MRVGRKGVRPVPFAGVRRELFGREGARHVADHRLFFGKRHRPAIPC